MERIERFTGQHSFLSNFHPVVVELDGMTFPSVEHAFQAAKSLDPVDRARLARALTPGHAKRLGRTLPLPPEWDTLRLEVMARLLAQKFRTPYLRRALLATGDAHLEEGNTWGDRFWGTCNGEGANHLGRMLMAVRAQLREEERLTPSEGVPL